MSFITYKEKGMKVTFDTNTLDKVVRPERFPKDVDRPHFDAVHRALVDGTIQGFVCETIITLEGIQKIDRGAVFGSTALKANTSEHIEEDGRVKIQMGLQGVQPDRKPLHPENAARMKAANELGVRLLRAPRFGSMYIEDPEGTVFAQETPADQQNRIDTFNQLLRAIEPRGVGVAIGKALGNALSQRVGVQEPWFHGLARAQDVHDTGKVARAVAEWADGDNVAAHIAYKNDIFCTGDLGKSAGSSILDAVNRAWLEQTYGVRFVTLPELATMLGDSPSA
jgi:hypothetical protein